MHDSRPPTSARPVAPYDGLLTVELRCGVLVLTGEIDTWSAPTLAAAIQPLVAAGGHIRVNARQITFMGSAALHVFHDAADRLADRGRLVILDPSRVALRAIELLGLRPDIDVVTPTTRVA